MDVAMLPATRQFEAALQHHRKSCVQKAKGLSRRRMRARPAAGPRAERLRRSDQRHAGCGAEHVSAHLCRGRALWRGAGSHLRWSTPGNKRRTSTFCTEVATFRSDGAYSDGRHPDAVRYTTSAEEDVRRRDFTINGLLLDPLCRPHCKLDPTTCPRRVIDHVGGLADLDAGMVRAIGRPGLRFEEDHLRMLRAVRFAARFGFELEPATAAAIRALAATQRRGEPRARARRADQNADRGPCAPGL